MGSPATGSKHSHNGAMGGHRSYKDSCHKDESHWFSGGMWVRFFSIWIITAAFLFALQPKLLDCGFVDGCKKRCDDRHDRHKDDCDFRWGAILGWSFVIAVVVSLLLWAVSCICHY